MLNIHYFASIREIVGKDSENLELPSGVSTVEDLVKHLSAVNSAFKSLAESEKKILVAVNQTVADESCILSKNDEVALFPPMTGG